MILSTLVNPILFQMRRLKSQNHEHAAKTAEVIENAPSFETMKEKGQEALKKFYELSEIGEDLSREEYINALEIVIGILYINIFAGRSMEWTTCTLDDVKDVLEGKTTSWFCRKFKTARTYGSRCIQFDESTINLLKTYVEKVFFNTFLIQIL